jgi:hypothetical protein
MTILARMGKNPLTIKMCKNLRKLWLHFVTMAVTEPVDYPETQV